jgi:hypothetical protein
MRIEADLSVAEATLPFFNCAHSAMKSPFDGSRFQPFAKTQSL